MPLPIVSAEPLDIPESAFNEHGLAVIMLPGGRYGGDWVIQAVSADGASQPAGEIRTSVDAHRKQALERDPGYPDRAVETVFTWLVGETKARGWRVVGFERLNDQYGPDERPFFCLARAIIASGNFAAEPGVTYADEMTLDAVMGYASASEEN